MKGDLPFDIVELVACPGLPPPAGALRELSYGRKTWLPEEDAVLRRLFAADAAMADIVESVAGRTYVAVRDRICVLGLRRNSTRPWSDLDLDYLEKRYGRDPVSAISAALGRSPAATYARAALLGLSEAAALDYTPWEDAQLRAGYEAGAPVSQIAVMIGRPLYGVLSRASKLGLRHVNLPADWSDAEQLHALDLARAGMEYRAIGVSLEKGGYPLRSKTAVGLFLRKTGYSRGWGRPWMPDEEELVRRAYADGDSLTPLVERLGRARTSLRWKVADLGLQGTHPNHDGFRQGPVWTEEQDTFLRENYGRGKMPTRKIAEKLGRKPMAVCQRANVLGLVHGYSRDWSEDELRAVQISFDAGLSLTDLAEAVARDVATVHRKTLELGIRFSNRPNKAPRGRRSERKRLSLGDILAMQNARKAA